jgi:hypothetical protein
MSTQPLTESANLTKLADNKDTALKSVISLSEQRTDKPDTSYKCITGINSASIVRHAPNAGLYELLNWRETEKEKVYCRVELSKNTRTLGKGFKQNINGHR